VEAALHDAVLRLRAGAAQPRLKRGKKKSKKAGAPLRKLLDGLLATVDLLLHVAIRNLANVRPQYRKAAVFGNATAAPAGWALDRQDIFQVALEHACFAHTWKALAWASVGCIPVGSAHRTLRCTANGGGDGGSAWRLGGYACGENDRARCAAHAMVPTVRLEFRTIFRALEWEMSIISARVVPISPNVSYIMIIALDYH
jgi:hypothetical protein